MNENNVLLHAHAGLARDLYHRGLGQIECGCYLLKTKKLLHENSLLSETFGGALHEHFSKSQDTGKLELYSVEF